jgi:hypothetical protein
MRQLFEDFTCPICGSDQFKMLDSPYPTLALHPPIYTDDYECQGCKAVICISTQQGYSDHKLYVTQSRIEKEPPVTEV